MATSGPLRRRLLLAALALAALAALWRFGGPDTADAWLAQALRDPADPRHAIGPRWLEGAAEDLTALGSHAIVVVVGLAVIAYAVSARLPRLALASAAAVAGGIAIDAVLKHAFARPRPPFAKLATFSFPSGHALLSALVYIGLAALLAAREPRPAARRCLIGIGVGITAVVGATRVYLGAHYPSDVVAGWIVGCGWAWACWSLGRRVEPATPD